MDSTSPAREPPAGVRGDCGSSSEAAGHAVQGAPGEVQDRRRNVRQDAVPERSAA